MGGGKRFFLSFFFVFVLGIWEREWEGEDVGGGGGIVVVVESEGEKWIG